MSMATMTPQRLTLFLALSVEFALQLLLPVHRQFLKFGFQFGHLLLDPHRDFWGEITSRNRELRLQKLESDPA